MAKRKKKWVVSSGDIREVAYAADQFEAWDTLRDRPAEEFGLVAEAEPDENGEPYPIRTSILMFRWHRDADAKRFIARMKDLEGIDTTAADLKAAGRSS